MAVGNQEERFAMEHHVVTGRIAAPPDIEPADLLGQLDEAVAKQASCKIYSPDLCDAAGEPERAAVERRRLDMLTGS